jgi:hypothetical protein
MRSRRVRSFRASVVITLAGCASHAPASVPAPARAHPIAKPRPRPTSHVVFRDPYCYRISPDGEQREEIDCPDALLPPAPSDRLIVRSSYPTFGCYRVPGTGEDGTQGRVRCPPGGPTVIASDQILRTSSGVAITLEDRSLTCSRQVYANPPYWTPIERCPTALLPTLAHGVKPTRDDEDGCFWGDIEVQCDPPRAGSLKGRPTISGEVVAIDPSDGGVVIIINRGTANHIDVGARGMLVGVKDSDFTVFRVTEHAAYAKAKMTEDDVKRSDFRVEVEITYKDVE